MNKPTIFASKSCVNAHVLSSMAIMLTACGGGAGDKAAVPAAPQLAAVSYNGALAPLDLYVSPSGADTNPGTQAAPFKTIVRAAKAATPGVTIRVLPGTYAGSFRTDASGTAEARIRYVSQTKWAPGSCRRPRPPRAPPGTTAAIMSTSMASRSTAPKPGRHQVARRPVHGRFLQQRAQQPCAPYCAHRALRGQWRRDRLGQLFQGHRQRCQRQRGARHRPGRLPDLPRHLRHTADSRVDNNLVYAISDAGIRMWHDATKG